MNEQELAELVFRIAQARREPDMAEVIDPIVLVHGGIIQFVKDDPDGVKLFVDGLDFLLEQEDEVNDVLIAREEAGRRRSEGA